MIEFKFCGGCNSQYDREKVYECLLKKLVYMISCDIRNKELVILNGCKKGCVKSKNYTNIYDKVINTQSFLISNNKVSEENIIDWIFNNI